MLIGRFYVNSDLPLLKKRKFLIYYLRRRMCAIKELFSTTGCGLDATDAAMGCRAAASTTDKPKCYILTAQKHASKWANPLIFSIFKR
jgi:hypothetical protein